MTNPEEIFVYWGDGSPPCMSVLITLEEKQLQGYKHRCLSFDRKEYQSPEILAINPRGELPSCKVGNLVLNESLAMCKYLEDNNKGRGASLEPGDPTLRGIMWQRVCEGLWNIARRCYKNYIKYLWQTPVGERDTTVVQTMRSEFITELRIWEKYLEESQEGGHFLVGSQLTLADVLIFPWIAFYVALGLNLSQKFPRLDHYYNKMMQRPSVKATFPKYWDGSVDRHVLDDLHQYA